MTVLAPAQAYARWAPTYDTENVVTTLDCTVVAALSPSPAGKRLLDVGCGTGRRLVGTGAALAIGVEPSPAMLAAGRKAHRFGPEVALLGGDARDLPVSTAGFDLAWCRLMIGHVLEFIVVYRELARVVAPGGTVVVTDFHPLAAAGGLRRTFCDHGDEIEVEHHVHSLADQVAAAKAAGLAVFARLDAAVGPAVRHFYAAADRLAHYESQAGMPLVAGLAFRRNG